MKTPKWLINFGEFVNWVSSYIPVNGLARACFFPVSRAVSQLTGFRPLSVTFMKTGLMEFSVPTFQASAIIAFIARSQGIKSARSSLLQSIVLMTPLPPPTIKPVGPFIFSIQPGAGSLYEAVTTKNKKKRTNKLHSKIQLSERSIFESDKNKISSRSKKI